MLVAHHIIDVLRGTVKRPQLIEFRRNPGDSTAREMADLIEGAQKFDFGEMVLELKEVLSSGPVYNLPDLTPDEVSFWRDGLIVLPYGACWFEFTLNNFRSGLLVREVGSEWRVHRIDYQPESVTFDGIECVVDRAQTTVDMAIEIRGNLDLFRQLQKTASPGGAATAKSIASSTVMAVYMTLMINSKTTEVVPAPPPPAALNRKRMKAGRAPLAEHRIVTIVPARYRADADPDAPKGTHRAPRLHWRRSHVRHYDRHTLASKWMPNIAHNGKTGWWVAVIPRMLVGRADLGEVSHEYRIVQDERNGLSGSLQRE